MGQDQILLTQTAGRTVTDADYYDDIQKVPSSSLPGLLVQSRERAAKVVGLYANKRGNLNVYLSIRMLQSIAYQENFPMYPFTVDCLFT